MAQSSKIQTELSKDNSLLLRMTKDFFQYQNPAEVMLYLQTMFCQFINSDTFNGYHPDTKSDIVSLQTELFKFLTGVHFIESPHRTPTEFLERHSNQSSEVAKENSKAKLDADIPI